MKNASPWANYLRAFITPEIAQVLCPGTSTFDFADIDRGRIICVAMPQTFQVGRRHVNTFLKMLFHTHAQRTVRNPPDLRMTFPSSGFAAMANCNPA